MSLQVSMSGTLAWSGKSRHQGCPSEREPKRAFNKRLIFAHNAVRSVRRKILEKPAKSREFVDRDLLATDQNVRSSNLFGRVQLPKFVRFKQVSDLLTGPR
jgi:hypothetical protein